MFITSFGEQNITYKCCSNFLIHLCPSTAPALSPPTYEQQKTLEWNKENQNYSILITGPNTNVNLVINDEDDLAIIDITLKKIKRMLIEKLNKSEE